MKALIKQGGFTLIELIVVVALMGIIVSSVLLSTSLIDPDQRIKDLSSKTSKLIYHVYQQASLQQENYAISMTKKGFVFLEFNGEEWFISEQKLLKEKSLPESIKSQLLIDGIEVKPIKSNKKNKAKLEPHILMLASGEMTPFEWLLSDEDTQTQYKITGSYTGRVMSELSEELN